MEIVAIPRMYPRELWDRAMRLVAEVRKEGSELSLQAEVPERSFVASEELLGEFAESNQLTLAPLSFG